MLEALDFVLFGLLCLSIVGMVLTGIETIVEKIIDKK